MILANLSLTIEILKVQLPVDLKTKIYDLIAAVYKWSDVGVWEIIIKFLNVLLSCKYLSKKKVFNKLNYCSHYNGMLFWFEQKKYCWENFKAPGFKVCLWLKAN